MTAFKLSLRSQHLVLAAFVALAVACKASESGAIPCNDDNNCPSTYPQCTGGGAGSSAGHCTEAVVGTPVLSPTTISVSPPAITGGLHPTLSLALPALSGNKNLARKVTLGLPAGGGVEPVNKSGGAPVTLADLGTTITVDAPASTATDDKTFTYTLTVSNTPSSAATATATGTLAVVPVPVLASSTFAVSPSSITSGTSPSIAVALPALAPASSTAVVGFTVSGCGTGAVTKSGGAAVALADLGTTIHIDAPASGTADNKACTYTLTVSNAATTPVTTTASGALTISPFEISSQPVNATASVGGSVTFSVTASVSQGVLGYQWQKDAVNLVGQTASTLTVNPVAAADAGLYSVVVTGTVGVTTVSATSNSASLNVAPVIGTQPVNVAAPVGASANFAVVASVSQGSLSYQWQKGGVNLSGKTASLLTFNPLAAADVGLYAVVVTSTFNGTTISTSSNIVSLNVAPVITTQPTNQTASVGGSASFTVVATVSSGTLSYQWKKGGVNIAGKTAATLTFSPVAAADAAMYTVVVTSTFNSTTISTTSSSVSLNVAPVITTQPTSQSAAQGATASFSVVATVSSGTLSYQWQKNGTSLTNTGNVTGATSATLSLATVGLSDVALYRVVVTSTFNSTTSPTTSNSVALTVNNALTSGIQRVGATATLLPNGRVLIAGGGNQSVNTACATVPNKSKTVEIFDPATGLSTQVGGATPAANRMMSIERCQHAAVLVGTSVYFFGGANTTSIDVFDTATSTFLTASLPTLNTVRLLPTATLLGAASATNSGKIVIAGGYDAAGANTLNSIELFTPGGTSTTYAALLGGNTAGTGRGDHTATLVGKWLFFTGGNYGSLAGISNSVDAIDTTQTAAAATIVHSTPSSNATARAGHSAVALSSGNAILLMGGFDATPALLQTVQTYAIDTATGSAGGAATANINMANVRAYFPVLQTKTTDKFLVFGGTSSGASPDVGSTSIELIDATNTSAITASSYQGGVGLSVARQESAAVLIANGTNPAFFVAGGDPGGTAANGTHEVIVDP